MPLQNEFVSLIFPKHKSLKVSLERPRMLESISAQEGLDPHVGYSGGEGPKLLLVPRPPLRWSVMPTTKVVLITKAGRF